MRRPILIILAIAAFGVVALTVARLHEGDGQAVVVVEDPPAPTRSPEPPIVVDVAGAGAHPRGYRPPGGFPVPGAPYAPGGATRGAAPGGLHQKGPGPAGPRTSLCPSPPP